VNPSPFLPPGVWFAWVMFMLGAIPANIIWLKMARVVRAKGLPFPIWNYPMITSLRNFHRVLRDEPDPRRRASHKRLVATFYGCFAWCLVWFAAFAVGGWRS